MRQGQVREKERLAEEAAKLAAAKTDLKARLAAGLQMLEAERTKLEAEVMEKRRKFQEEAKLAARIGAAVAEIGELQERIAIMEQDREEERSRRRGEEQDQIQSELGELGKSLATSPPPPPRPIEMYRKGQYLFKIIFLLYFRTEEGVNIAGHRV